MITHVIIDIEGTTSSTWFVQKKLYPYSRERFDNYLAQHRDRPDVQAIVEMVRELASEPDANDERVIWWLNHWLDGDKKMTPLKAFQGWIWDEGFAKGELTSHFFDDVIPAMRRWKAAGLDLSIFSSGSVNAQRAWFGHSPEGDILSLFSNHFDTENTGHKRVPESYHIMTERLGVPAAQIVFLSDLKAELDAAREAGWNTVGVRREGDEYWEAGVSDHLAITSFDQLDLTGDVPRVKA
jgi:enolase-phosphatase E1